MGTGPDAIYCIDQALDTLQAGVAVLDIPFGGIWRFAWPCDGSWNKGYSISHSQLQLP